MTSPPGEAGGFPVVCFALRRESRAFRKRFAARRLPLRSGSAWMCSRPGLRLLVVETGIGSRRTSAALDALGDFKPTLLVAAGFCGGLVDSLRPGDVIWANDVIADPPLTPVRHSAAAGQFAPSVCRRGTVVSVSRLVAAPADKQALAGRTGALAVDMESATAGQWAADHGVPFACVRSVSDDAAAELSPELVRLLSAGHVSALRAAIALLWQPRLCREFLRLARDTRRAADALAAALDQLLSRRGPALCGEPLEVEDGVQSRQRRHAAFSADNRNAAIFE